MIPHSNPNPYLPVDEKSELLKDVKGQENFTKNEDVTVPPLLLAVLVQTVARSIRKLLQSAFHSQHLSVDTEFCADLSGVQSQILLELLKSLPNSYSSGLPHAPNFGHGYPDCAILTFCIALYKCARDPEVPISLPKIDMPGILEANPFCTKSPEEEYLLRTEVAKVIGDIDENMDLMNVPECATSSGFGLVYGCLCNMFSSDEPGCLSRSSVDYNQRMIQCVTLDCVEFNNSQTQLHTPVRLPTNCIDRMSRLLIMLCREPTRLLYLTGLRCTFGSCAEHCPPSRQVLEEAFNLPNLYTTRKKKSGKSKSILTVGGRALCKHAPRSKDGFWTKQTGVITQTPCKKVCQPLTGSEMTKNLLAQSKLRDILDACVWVNIHSILDAGAGFGKMSSEECSSPVPGETSTQHLSASICILEVRVSSGHGARWSWKNAGCSSTHEQRVLFEQLKKNLNDIETEVSDSSPVVTFRGFVEPMMLNGHDNKWRH